MDKKLTPDKLRSYKGFENSSDDDAEKIIDQLERLSYITVTMALEKKKRAILYIRSNSQKSVNNQKEILKHHLCSTGIEPVYVMEGESIKSKSTKITGSDSN